MSPKYSLIVCIHDEVEYKKIAFASIQKLTQKDVIEIIEINNTLKKLTVPQALNKGLMLAKGQYLVFFQQDVFFPENWIEQLDNQLELLKTICSDWGVLGILGVGFDHLPCGHIVDRGCLLKSDNLPIPVQSVSEVCFIIKKESGLTLNEELISHHLYATELCLQAKEKGLSCFAIDACVEYLATKQRLDKSFWLAGKKLQLLYRSKNVPAVISSPYTVIKLKNTIGSWIEFYKVKKLRRQFKRASKKKSLVPVFKLTQKPEAYFSSSRFEMLSYISGKPQRTLEIGSGKGLFSLEVKSRYECETWALEYDPNAAETARCYLDRVICGDATELIKSIPDQYFDVIFCFDVLEHLIDPFEFLCYLKNKLNQDGVLIASIPNIRHYKTLFDLFFKGNWTYRNVGTLDITHLRFFTYSS